jgi:DNA processing protein
VADQLAMVPGGLSAYEQSVFKLLSADNPAHIDALVNQTSISISDLTAALLALEMRDLVRALPGRCFVRKM